MVEESIFRGVIDFMGKIGVYDVILPFLLVFTIVFAILEKTRILGTEKVNSIDVTRKNLNTIVAFSISFFVIASIQLVNIISSIMANVALILIISVCFLMMVGVFYKDGEFDFAKQHKGWTTAFIIISFIALVVIFLNAMDWLKYIVYLFQYWNADWAASILFMALVIGAIVYITWDKAPKTPEAAKK